MKQGITTAQRDGVRIVSVLMAGASCDAGPWPAASAFAPTFCWLRAENVDLKSTLPAGGLRHNALLPALLASNQPR
jgi:hypothetical protein